ncbi:hypothetical protein D3C84_978940 [compost metagenome]
MRPSTPMPGRARRSLAVARLSPCSFAAATTARARGWWDPCSMAAASASSSVCGWPLRLMKSVSCGLPSVRVPVLSKATVSMWASRSRAAPPLIRAPCRVAAARAEVTAAGVEITKAQGQPMSSSARAR